ncbi:MAG: hypothetical protein ACLFNW_10990, partial [Desulfobacterales bacterium]
MAKIIVNNVDALVKSFLHRLMFLQEGSPAVGVGFFAPDRFRNSSNAFAKISKTRPIGLKQFEIFTLRHLLNF